MMPGLDDGPRPAGCGGGSGADLSSRTCWLVHSGAKGNAVQCEGVATALGLDFETRTVRLRPPWLWMAPWGPAQPDPTIRPPWPDILIASGRYSIPYARMVRRRSGGRTFTLALKNPRVRFSDFDLVWAPLHDGVSGPNVVVTVTSPHPITRAALAEAAAAFADAFAGLPRPLVGVMVGGANRSFRLGAGEARQLARDLLALAGRHGAGLAFACSRRTGREVEAAIAGELAGSGAYLWAGEGPNPYQAILAHADALVVTCESTNMVGEAAVTGKPIYLYRLPGGSRRFARFHDAMIGHGWARWFDGSLDRWAYEPVDATGEIAAAVRAAYAAKAGG